jgi:hypothetical protein
VERFVFNALAADAALQFGFCSRSQRVKGGCTFGDYFLESPRHGESIHLGSYIRASIASTRLKISDRET